MSENNITDAKETLNEEKENNSDNDQRRNGR